MRDCAGSRPELGLATPFRVTQCPVARAHCYGLRRSALPAFLSRISRSRDFGAPIRADDYYCANGPLPVQSQSLISAFILFLLGLSVWLNNAWLLVTLIPAVCLIAMVVIPREEKFLERNFNDQYRSYKARVRRWL
jgi:hypothetical protein